MVEKMTTIQLSDFGKILITRADAKKIFAIANDAGFNVTFNFEWVSLMNTSFADELFAKAIVSWKKFKITNMDNDTIKWVIIFVTEARKNRKIQLA